jgi:hypothetical protein
MNERRPIGLTVPYREVGYKEKKEWEIKPKWIGLTDVEIADIVKTLERGNFLVAIQNIEAKLKEKNGM